MAKKNRFPQHYGWEDFLSFMRELLLWLTGQVGEPDYQADFVTGLEGKVDDYEAALIDYSAKKNLAPEQRKLVDIAVKNLRESLIQAKLTLPVFFPDPAVLGEFDLAQDVPSDEDDLYIMASACLAHWDLVKLLPEYAPLVADFSALQTAFDDFVSSRTTYQTTFQAMQTAQNELIEKREPINTQERKLFDWYRSRHRESQAEWWTASPWGISSGGTQPGEPGEPVGAFPDKVSNMTVKKASPPQTGAIVSCDPLEGVIGYNVCKAKVPTGMPRPTRPAEKWVFIEEPPVLDNDVEIGFDYYYWMCGVDENNVEGEWSDAMMTWVG
jgi:hypothetical protein